MRTNLWGAGVLSLLLILAGCVTSEFAAINTEPGFYYGFGSGKTEAAAQDAAFNDLIFNTLTTSGSIKKEKKAKVTITGEMKGAFTSLNLKPYLSEKKTETSFTAVYRIKFADWTAAETVRLTKLQGELVPKFNALASDTKKPLGGKLADAVKMVQNLDNLGVTLSLRIAAADSALLSDAIQSWAQAQVAGASLRLTPEAGLVDAGQSVSAVLTDKAGKPLAGIPLAAVWETVAATAPALVLTTDAKGAVAIPYPADEAFRNAKPTLHVTSRLVTLGAEGSFLASLDGIKADGNYRNAVVTVQLKTDEIKVPGGTYTIGAVKQDRRAGGNEKPRTVTVGTYYVDRTPVTNAQFKNYLVTSDVPKDQWPDFLDGEQGGADQPVVGVSLEDAQKYAKWVSAQLGVTKRLPTEDEYEIAARAGQQVIFPWGDQAPTDGVRANYKGNKKFDNTSPVGSFANGANAWGLLDMVGNVWQWTTTSPDSAMSADPSYKLVKGGSWLDGPNELRISNRRAVDPNETATDLGFRLVREEKN